MVYPRAPAFSVRYACNFFRNFHSFSNLRAQVLSGARIAKEIRSEIAHKVVQYNAAQFGQEASLLNYENLSFRPKLAIIQVGDRPDSTAYVNAKTKAASSANISSQLFRFEENVQESELLRTIEKFNYDPSVHGILVQLPLPKHLNEAILTNAVVNEKDVDGFNRFNVGELSKREGQPLHLPCTPSGVLQLIKQTGVNLRGKNAVIIGRSDIVGTPTAALLRKEDCTVTICHRYSGNISSFTKDADIVVAAVGIPNFVRGDWIKEGAIVIDVGINYVGNSDQNKRKLIGDVDFESVEKKASFLTPVPGGVGPMTVAMLCSNVFKAAMMEIEQIKTILPLLLKFERPVPSDFAIAKVHKPKEIDFLAKELGLLKHEVELFGHYKAKLDPKEIIGRLQKTNTGSKDDRGNYVLVAGITPTPLGEGKSTTTMGLAQALTAHEKQFAIANVRQPSMGPTFGVKGGAAGGGYSQVIPMDEFNMHLTGDIHAISAAQNLVCAAVDTRMFHEHTSKTLKGFYSRLVPSKKGRREFTKSMRNRLEKLGINKANPDDLSPEEIDQFAMLNIDPASITMKRVVDCNDRLVREMTIGEGANESSKFPPRKTGMDITAASELMAVLALSTSLTDLRERVGRMVVGTQRETGAAITCEDVGCAGAVTALLKDAFKPNLMQTIEGGPVLVHCGPFANISIGASSVIADQLALNITAPSNPRNNGRKGFVVTESGFDFAMGGERFINIKSRVSGLEPDVVVLVATTRALKSHGGAPNVKPGQSLPQEYTSENVDILKKGISNLAKQIENVKEYGIPVVVAINVLQTDTQAEIQLIKEESLKANADYAVVSNHWAEGGFGAVELAKSVYKAANHENSRLSFLYDVDDAIEVKIRTIANKMYGASEIELSPLAKSQVETYAKQGYGNLPICIAKTQYSLSHDPSLKGVPTGFTLPIKEVRCSAGAGYLYALADKIMTIPGLPTHAGYMNVEVDENGEIKGLF